MHKHTYFFLRTWFTSLAALSHTRVVFHFKNPCRQQKLDPNVNAVSEKWGTRKDLSNQNVALLSACKIWLPTYREPEPNNRLACKKIMPVTLLMFSGKDLTGASVTLQSNQYSVLTESKVIFLLFHCFSCCNNTCKMNFTSKISISFSSIYPLIALYQNTEDKNIAQTKDGLN